MAETDGGGRHRTMPRAGDEPMHQATHERLYQLLRERYPFADLRRVIEICPAAVWKTIDNERDAQQTIRNLEASEGVPRV